MGVQEKSQKDKVATKTPVILVHHRWTLCEIVAVRDSTSNPWDGKTGTNTRCPDNIDYSTQMRQHNFKQNLGWSLTPPQHNFLNVTS